MTGIGLLDGVDGESTDGIDTKLIERILLAHGCSGAGVGAPAKIQRLDDTPG
jgi:hypothetical protein